MGFLVTALFIALVFTLAAFLADRSDRRADRKENR